MLRRTRRHLHLGHPLAQAEDIVQVFLEEVTPAATAADRALALMLQRESAHVGTRHTAPLIDVQIVSEGSEPTDIFNDEENSMTLQQCTSVRYTTAS